MREGENARATQCIMMNISTAGGLIHFNPHFLHFTLITSQGETFPFVTHYTEITPANIIFEIFYLIFQTSYSIQHAGIVR